MYIYLMYIYSHFYDYENNVIKILVTAFLCI